MKHTGKIVLMAAEEELLPSLTRQFCPRAFIITKCLWLKLRPHRLPGFVTSMYFAVVYNPPNSVQTPKRSYLLFN